MVPRTCTICPHPQRPAIDAALVAGEPYRRVAALWGVSPDAVKRHKAHLPVALAKAAEAEAVADADDLLAHVRALRARALGILTQAEREKDWRGAIAGLKVLVEIAELLGKLTGELAKREAGRQGATLEELIAGSHEAEA